MKRKLLTYFVLSLSAVSPSVSESSSQRTVKEESNIVAGSTEQTFTQTYGVKLKLPMPEKEFLALLGKLKLKYKVLRRSENLISAPFHRKLDVSMFERCYQIYGRLDRKRHVSESYLAYIDRNSQLVYLENAFSYPDP